MAADNQVHLREGRVTKQIVRSKNQCFTQPLRHPIMIAWRSKIVANARRDIFQLIFGYKPRPATASASASMSVAKS